MGDRESIMLAIQKKMKEILREKTLENIVDFAVEEVEEITNNSRTKKYKFVIPYL